MTRQGVNRLIQIRRDRTEKAADHLNRINVSPYRLSKSIGVGWYVANRLINRKYKYVQGETLEKVEKWLRVHENGYRWDL